MRVNESDLTGEPSCSKTVEESEFKPDATYPSNYVCRGSSVMEGHGMFVVENAPEDLRRTELWYQMAWWLNERHPEY